MDFCSDIGNDDDAYFGALVRMFEQALGYRINGVPAGQYSVRCWHERLAALRLVHFVVREALGLPREFLLFTEHSS